MPTISAPTKPVSLLVCMYVCMYVLGGGYSVYAWTVSMYVCMYVCNDVSIN